MRSEAIQTVTSLGDNRLKEELLKEVIKSFQLHEQDSTKKIFIMGGHTQQPTRSKGSVKKMDFDIQKELGLRE